MFKLAGYGLRDTNGDLVPQLFKNREVANAVKTQNHLGDDSVVQLFYFEKLQPLVVPGGFVNADPIEANQDPVLPIEGDVKKEDDGTA